MNQAQIQAQIENACKRAYAEGTQDAVNKARTVMPTILANAYKQAVMDTAGFLAKELDKPARKYGRPVLPALYDLKAVLTDLCNTGTLPELEKTTQGGIEPQQRVAPAWTKVSLEPGCYHEDSDSEPFHTGPDDGDRTTPEPFHGGI